MVRKNGSAQQLVLYNETDRSLQVSQDNNSFGAKIKLCGECGRPYDTGDNDNKVDCNNNNNAFMDRNYFRLLDISSRQPKQQQSSPLIHYTIKDNNNSKSPHTNGRKSKLSSSSTTLSDMCDSIDFESIHPKNLSDSSINQGYYRRFFREDIKLGRGAGGSVFKCQHVLDGIELGTYAVKKVPVGDDHSWLNRMLKEVHMLENLRHPNIIEYKHAWLEYHQLSLFGPPIPCLFILMQLAEGGNLEEFILKFKICKEKEKEKEKEENNISINLYCEWFEQICHGLAHLHRCGILHRDLKPSNILLKFGQDGKVQLLITDFGECTNVSDSIEDDNANRNRTGATGTIEFVAPELLRIDRKSGKYLYQQSKSTDIWSLGLIFYFMITGKLPYADIEDIEALKGVMCSLNRVILPKEAAKLPKGFKKALGAMLQVDPELRPSIEQILILIREEAKSSPIQQQKPNQEAQEDQKDFVSPKFQRRLSLPPPPFTDLQTQFPRQIATLDENTRITLALLMICISVIPTYPKIPSLRRVILALVFTFAALKTNKQRSAIILLVTYSILISAFYFNKID